MKPHWGSIGAESRMNLGIRREIRNSGWESSEQSGQVPSHAAHQPRLRPEAGLRDSRLPTGRICSSLPAKTSRRDQNAKGSRDRCAVGGFAHHGCGLMGWVPTHGPDCMKVRSFPTRCRFCGLAVVYFECSCGSRVLLRDGQAHNCGRIRRHGKPRRLWRRMPIKKR